MNGLVYARINFTATTTTWKRCIPMDVFSCFHFVYYTDDLRWGKSKEISHFCTCNCCMCGLAKLENWNSLTSPLVHYQTGNPLSWWDYKLLLCCQKLMTRKVCLEWLWGNCECMEEITENSCLELEQLQLHLLAWYTEHAHYTLYNNTHSPRSQGGSSVMGR